ncbi:MAG TPA: hypothetical protein V6C72_07975, partial [Chroococcales cyanobacterium]
MPQEISSGEKLPAHSQLASRYAEWLQTLSTPPAEGASSLKEESLRKGVQANEQLQAKHILPELQLVDGRAHTINQRQHRQQQRILNGLHSGELTQKEFERLEKTEKSIAGVEKKMRDQDPAHEGNLTYREKEQLHKLLDMASNDIFRQKHDGQKAPKNPIDPIDPIDPVEPPSPVEPPPP